MIGRTRLDIDNINKNEALLEKKVTKRMLYQQLEELERGKCSQSPINSQRLVCFADLIYPAWDDFYLLGLPTVGLEKGRVRCKCNHIQNWPKIVKIGLRYQI